MKVIMDDGCTDGLYFIWEWMRLAELYPELLVYSVSRPACVPRSRREDSRYPLLFTCV